MKNCCSTDLWKHIACDYYFIIIECQSLCLIQINSTIIFVGRNMSRFFFRNEKSSVTYWIERGNKIRLKNIEKNDKSE